MLEIDFLKERKKIMDDETIQGHVASINAIWKLCKYDTQIQCEESEEMDKWEERKKKLPDVPACNQESSINDNRSQ